MKLRTLTLALAIAGGALLPARLTAQTQAAPAEPPGPDTVVFTPKRGAVTFTHGKHAGLTECVTCHHESKPEQPLPADNPRQKCSACHTDEPVAPMKTSRRDAFHDTAKKEGTCLTCHNQEVAQGKQVPVKCNDCHVRNEQEQ